MIDDDNEWRFIQIRDIVSLFSVGGAAPWFCGRTRPRNPKTEVLSRLGTCAVRGWGAGRKVLPLVLGWRGREIRKDASESSRHHNDMREILSDKLCQDLIS